MKSNGVKCAILALVLFLPLGSSFSQERFGTEEDRKRLYYLNTQYIQSWVRSDTGTYNRLLWAEDFVHQNSADGLLYPKEALMPRFGKPRFDQIEYFYPENVTIQFITPDAAMIYARTPFRAVGQTTESLSQYNDVYVRRNRKWICVSANVTMITEPGEEYAGLTKIPPPVALFSHVSGSDSDISMLKKLNQEHAEAFLRSKPEMAESILADDYVLLDANGLLYTRQQAINRITASGNGHIVSYAIENTAIQFVAADVALVHSLAVVKLKDGRSSGVQYNDVYVRRNSVWVCVSGNNTPVRN